MNKTSRLGLAPEFPASQHNTIFLQAVAALLIANSHLEGFYPRPWMAADGMIGNSIFFFLSGYGITKSLAGREQRFAGYYWRRILRIYPTVWVVQVIFYFLLQGGWKTALPGEYISLLVYPTFYSYIRLIMVFYILFYLLKPWLRPDVLLKLIAALFVPLLGLYAYELFTHRFIYLLLGTVNDPLWGVFFFQLMLLGSFVSLRKGVAAHGITGASLKLAAVFLLYVALKFVMVLGWKIPWLGFPWSRVFILLHLLVFPIVYYAFVLAASKPVWEGLQKSPAAFWIVAWVGGLTLEIYTVHWFVMENSMVRGWIFPLNVVAFFAITLILSQCVSQAARGVRSALEWTVCNGQKLSRPSASAK